MDVHVLLDDVSNNNFSFNSVMHGIESEVKRKKLKLIMHKDIRSLDRQNNVKPIIVYTDSEYRATRYLTELQELQYHPIFVAMQFETYIPFSGILENYTYAANCLTQLVALGAGGSDEEIAFVGFNSDSIADKLRFKGFVEAVSQLDKKYAVFYNYGDIQKCVEKFWESHGTIKKIVCANDLVAIVLLKKINESGENWHDYSVCGFGNWTISQYCDPPLTTAVIDYEIAGRYAVNLYGMLLKMRQVQNIQITVNSRIILRDSIRLSHENKLEFGGLENHSMKKIDFYGDETVFELDTLSKMLSLCDRSDINILDGLLNNKTYEQISEIVFGSVNMVKYRIKRIEQNCNNTKIQSIINRLKDYGIIRLHI